MSTDHASLVAVLVLAMVLAWPAVFAAWRRHVNRGASEVAAALEAFADRSRLSDMLVEVDAALAQRIARLRLPEYNAFEVAPRLPNATPALVAAAAARLALRLRRRIAFERKMLARTASGRRRGAIGGALPPLVLLGFAGSGADLPGLVLLLLIGALGLGSWLQVRIAKVAI